MNRLYYIYARHCLLILSKNKENVPFTWATGVQNVLFVTITGDKFGIYVPICQLFILHIVICFYIFVVFPLENVKDELLETPSEYLLITEVKFITCFINTLGLSF